jgi:hypothetical protein
MADEKLSQKDITTTTNGAYYYTIIPGLLGIWLPRRISWASLMLPLTTRIEALENSQGGYATTKYTNRNASFTHAFTANQKLEAIDMRLISGSPAVRFGTTVGGDEILSDRELDVLNDSNNIVSLSFQSATTMYITITGGACNITLTIRNAIL